MGSFSHSKPTRNSCRTDFFEVTNEQVVGLVTNHPRFITLKKISELVHLVQIILKKNKSLHCIITFPKSRTKDVPKISYQLVCICICSFCPLTTTSTNSWSVFLVWADPYGDNPLLLSTISRLPWWAITDQGGSNPNVTMLVKFF